MILKGTFLHTPALGELEVRQNAYLVSEGETIVGLYDTLPPQYAGQPAEDWGDALIIPAFTDLHIHAPQIINRGIGYDKELLPWLETYTFPAEARFADSSFADRAWKAFLNHLWAVGTLRFAAFATVHKEAAWRLMELSEASGLPGLTGQAHTDRNCPGRPAGGHRRLPGGHRGADLPQPGGVKTHRFHPHPPVRPLHHSQADGRSGPTGREV